MRAISSSVAGAQLLGGVGHRHVVELGRAQQALDVLGVAEHRRAELGVVAAHALEDAGAVVQAVRQDVDLGVLPGDEFSVHPDEVGGLHVHLAPIRGCRALPGSPARCLPRRPDRRCAGPRRVRASTADSTAAASLSKPRPWRSIIAAERNIASGLATPLPGDVGRGAVHGLEQPGSPSAPSEALGSIPIEPVSIAASSERMSPNMFSVRITSKCARRGDELHRRVVDEHVLELDVGELARVQLA